MSIDARETTFSGRELSEWVSTHGPEDINNVLDGFLTDIKTLCQSMANLYEKDKIPLAVIGVSCEVRVTMGDKDTGRVPLVTARVGNPEGLLDSMRKKLENKG